MLLEVSLTPALYPYRTLKENHVTVAIDVLRATTAVCAAFQAGCREVVPLDSLEALEPYRSQGYAVAAERGGKKLPGSDYGNSPTEYMSCDMRGVRLAYSTTNGTVSMLRAADAALALVGAFANLDALADRLQSLSVPSLREGCRGGGLDVVLLCSGWQNDFCIEDTLLAGALIDRLTHSSVSRQSADSSPNLGVQIEKTIISSPLPGSIGDMACDRSGAKLGEVAAQRADGGVCIHGDAAHMALEMWRQAQPDPYAYCQRASHVHRLEGFGPQAQADIAFAFKMNTCPLVPVLRKGVLTL